MQAFAAVAGFLLLAGCLTGGSGPGGAGVSPTGGGFVLAPFLSSDAGLDDPVFLTHAGDGSGRLFIVEQGGLVRVWKDGHLMREPFLDIAPGGTHPKVVAGGERGLLGLAFHPGFADNGRLFVHYTGSGGAIVIEEYHADPGSDVGDAASGRVLLRQEHPDNANHNGGMLAFGPDGSLYAGLGDGGGSGDAPNNAQDLDTLLGKLVRLDVDGDCGAAYCIPDGNPFAGRDGRDEVWSYGLRNPWRFSFDRATGDLWIGDVGQNQWEEIDREPAGAGGMNHGWSRFEGAHAFRADRQALGATPPVAEYDHGWGGATHCAVTGGYVYRGHAIPDLVGTYVFADYCSGYVWTLKGGVMELAHDTRLNVSSFGEDEDGELYLIDHAGEVRRLVAA